jgi:hypothetical protein
MLLLLEFPKTQRFTSEERVLWRSTDEEICSLQGDSQIVSQAGEGLELANDQGAVNQNQEQKITILLKTHNKAS